MRFRKVASWLCLTLYFLASVPATSGADAPTKYRMWTDSNGKKSSVQMAVLSSDAASVTLKRQDNGKVIQLPLARLSDSDRAHIKNVAAARQTLPKTFVNSISGSDWPFFRGPNRDGVLDIDFTPTDNIELLWKSNGGEGKGSIAIADGLLYLHGKAADHSSQIRCLDAATGKDVWAANVEQNTDSTPSVLDGRVYHTDDDRWVYCFDAKTGNPIWKSEQLPESTRRREWGHSGSTLLWDDLVIVNIGYGAALNKDTGKIVWQHNGFSGMATPVVFNHRGKTAVAIFTGDKLIAREPTSGAELWSVPWESNHGVNAPEPVFLEGGRKMFLTGDYGMGRALYDISGSQPQELWYIEGGCHSFASPIVYRDSLYSFLHGDMSLIDLETGEPKHKQWLDGGALILGEYAVTVTKDGKVRMFKLNDDGIEKLGAARVTESEIWNIPAYSDGKLYVRNHKGSVYCVQIGK